MLAFAVILLVSKSTVASSLVFLTIASSGRANEWGSFRIFIFSSSANTLAAGKTINKSSTTKLRQIMRTQRLQSKHTKVTLRALGVNKGKAYTAEAAAKRKSLLSCLSLLTLQMF